MKIGPAARLALRKAVFGHDGWNKEFRRTHNMDASNMSYENWFKACELLGLDIKAIVANAEAATTENTSDNAQAFKAAHARRMAEQDDELRREQEYNDSKRNAAAAAADAFASCPNTTETKAPAIDVGEDDLAATLLQTIRRIGARAIDRATVEAIVNDAIAKSEKERGGIHTIELTTDGAPTGQMEGRFHPKFPELLKRLSCRMADGYVPNLWIAGPAGSGKTKAASQAAEALGLPFHTNGALLMAHEVLGYLDANGCYHRTAFREAYENGGIYLFDEIDGSSNEALLPLNSALANGFCTFPDGQVTRHKDCRIIAAANTWGFGATAEYVGRAKIDSAVISRFAPMAWDYDEELERDICGNAEFAKRVQKARKAARDYGIQVVISPRDSMMGASYIAGGFTSDEAAEMTFLGRLKPEQRSMIERG